MSLDKPPGLCECFFPGTPASIARARRWLAGVLAELGVPGVAAEGALLVCSELATNAVRHTRSGRPYGRYHVWLYHAPAVLWLEVTDYGGPDLPHPRAPEALAESGNGLALVAQLATRWWTRGDPHGRTVGAELALPN